jgi:hypothetical protein
MFDTWETMLNLLKEDHNGLQERLSRIIAPGMYPLENYQSAFESLISGKEMKLVFSPQADK